MVQLTPVLPNFCIVMSEASNIPLPNWVGPVQLWAVRTTTTLLGTENPICGKLPARIFNYLRVYVPGIYIRMYKALRSASGFRRPLRSLKKVKRIAKEANCEARAFRCKPPTCKCQEPRRHAPGKQLGRHMHVPNAKCMDIERTPGERAVLYRVEIETIGTSFAHHTIPVRVVLIVYFVSRADFDLFVRFENSACCINARHVLALANSICLIALSRADCVGLCCACGTTTDYSSSNDNMLVHGTKKKSDQCNTFGKIRLF